MNASSLALDRCHTALDDLAGLGGPDRIAAFLAREGHHGTRQDMCCCPVSRYLTAVSGRRVEVAEARWGFEGGVMDEGYTPRPVAEFIRAFDDGHYPELTEQQQEAKAS